jgi:hypothetical protein
MVDRNLRRGKNFSLLCHMFSIHAAGVCAHEIQRLDFPVVIYLEHCRPQCDQMRQPQCKHEAHRARRWARGVSNWSLIKAAIPIPHPKPAPGGFSPASAKAWNVLPRSSPPAGAKMLGYPANPPSRFPRADRLPPRVAVAPSACPAWRSRSAPSAIGAAPSAW